MKVIVPIIVAGLFAELATDFTLLHQHLKFRLVVQGCVVVFEFVFRMDFLRQSSVEPVRMVLRDMVRLQRILDGYFPVAFGVELPSLFHSPHRSLKSFFNLAVEPPHPLTKADDLFVERYKKQITNRFHSDFVQLRVFPIPRAKALRLGYVPGTPLGVELPSVVLAFKNFAIS